MMFKKIRQALCRHSYESEMIMGIEPELLRTKNIKKEVPIASCLKCTKCDHIVSQIHYLYVYENLSAICRKNTKKST